MRECWNICSNPQNQLKQMSNSLEKKKESKSRCHQLMIWLMQETASDYMLLRKSDIRRNTNDLWALTCQCVHIHAPNCRK